MFACCCGGAPIVRPVPVADPFFGDAPHSLESWHFTGNSLGREGWQIAALEGGSVTFISPPPTMAGVVRISVADPAAPGGSDSASWGRVDGGGSGFAAASRRARFRRIVRLLNEPTAAEDYAARIGHVNGFQLDGSSVFMGLHCDFAAFGPNWQLTVDDGIGGTDVQDTGVAVSSLLTLPFAVEYRVLDGAAGIVLALEGVDVAQSAVVPANGVMQSSFQLVKRSGTEARTLDCDFASEEFQLPEAFA